MSSWQVINNWQGKTNISAPSPFNLFFVGCFTVILLAILLLFFNSPVEAHELLIEEVKEGEVKLGFDDGTSAVQIDVKIYEGEEVVYQGRTDREGEMKFPEDLKWDKIEARDNYGHSAFYEKGEEESFNLPRWLGAIIGLTVLLSAAAFSHYYSR